MTQIAIQGLQRQKDLLEVKINRLAMQYQKKAIECHELGDVSDEEMEEELQDISSRTLSMQEEIARLNQHCRQLAQQKKRMRGVIRQFEQKKQKLSLILQAETSKLTALLEENSEIENSIKTEREEYQKCQEDIYDLNLKAENIKKYGFENVPQRIADLLKKKEEVEFNLKNIEQQINSQQQSIGQMVEQYQIQIISQRISGLERQQCRIKQVEKHNELLQKENNRLNTIKIEYEENPNLEIKSLEGKLQEKEAKIVLMEREKTNIYKKTKECLHKINEYKKYLGKESREESTNSLMSPRERKENLSRNKKSNKKDVKKSIYNEIKQDLQKEKGKTIWMDELKKCSSGRKEQIDGNGGIFGIMKRINKAVLFMLMMLLTGAIVYSHFYSK